MQLRVKGDSIVAAHLRAGDTVVVAAMADGDYTVKHLAFDCEQFPSCAANGNYTDIRSRDRLESGERPHDRHLLTRASGCAFHVCLGMPPAGFEAARRRLMHWHLERSGSDIVCEAVNHETERVETKQLPGWGAEPVNAWVLTLRAWCVLLWGQPRVGPRFPPLDIPLHGAPPHQCIRMRDLPDHVRPAVGRRMRGSTCPYVGGVPDAVYPWDWTDFLAGRR